ncbi:MAG: ATP-dependent DNA ligase [Thermoprotei archaeon]|nr:ATP-dependent DNA ligase [TACK group archaeon]
MLYSEVASFYSRIEGTTKRLEMTKLLVEMFKHASKEEAAPLAYLTLGKLYPDFLGIELGLGEKLVSRALSRATGTSLSEIEAMYKKMGDLGLVASELMKKRGIQMLAPPPEPTLLDVYTVLDRIARSAGGGSQDEKMAWLAGILGPLTPDGAKYLIRTIMGKLRLGVADMTILDALADAYAGGDRSRIERAYNLTSDIGEVAGALASGGLEALSKVKPQPGKPIRPMLAERLPDPEEVLQKLGGKAALEYKYDGERCQAHLNDGRLTLFSRRLESITSQFPDVVQALTRSLKVRSAIVEGEIVGVDPNTGELLPFQQLMHRRRKHGVEEALEEIPTTIFLFDVMYLDGQDLTPVPYLSRRQALEGIVTEGSGVELATRIIVDNLEDFMKFFDSAISDGCEGVMAKDISGSSVYQAGARGWLWIKYKRDYKSELADTLDLVVVGAFNGRGKRAGTYGALLLAAYDKDKDEFCTVCKLGSGFSDEELSQLPKRLSEAETREKPARVNSVMKPDVWFEPKFVLEVRGAEITLSPIHTSAFGRIRPEAGLAVRFPRFTGRWRTDKSPEDATTTQELLEMYNSQLKKIS